MIDLFHCFGANPDHRVDAATAADMLRASRCTYLAVNTHTVNEVRRGDDLPVGYWTATLGSVLGLMDGDPPLRPVLNINHPTTAEEAVARARRAVELTGVRVIKLEVLEPGLTTSRNDAVVAAARRLVADGLEVWPLIAPDRGTFEECAELGASMIRVMGSPIGSRRGIDPAHRETIAGLVAQSPVPVMLDGGIGTVTDATGAFELGFQSVLVNSCLFADGADPVAVLREFRAALDKGTVPVGTR